MLSFTFTAVFLAVTRSLCQPTNLTSMSTMGLMNPTIHRSRGGQAVCASGSVMLTASAANIELDLALPANQSDLTEIMLKYVTSGSTFIEGVLGNPITVGGTYSIGATLCTPKSNLAPKDVQLLTHGDWLDRYLWDFAPGYSYVDAAADAGYASFFYDRLGAGTSTKADPIKDVQLPLQVEILNDLAAMLRSGSVGGNRFEYVVGVGHSTGSTITQGVTSKYSEAFNATILEGFSVNSTGLSPFLTGLDLTFANQNQPSRFGSLNNGFVVPDDIVSVQTGFFTSPGFDQNILQQAQDNKGTACLGELFTLFAVGGLAPGYTRPIAVINGEEDLPFCLGNCSYPVNLAAEVAVLYPNVPAPSFGWYLASESGHAPNLHYSANAAYSYIQTFLKEQGLGV